LGFAAVERQSYAVWGIEVADLAGGTDQVGVIQLRRDIVFVRLGESARDQLCFARRVS
jgi:hypothetical protein